MLGIKYVKSGFSILLIAALSLFGLVTSASASAITAVSFTGTAYPGSVLTASPTAGDGTISYQWYDCSSPVSAGTLTLTGVTGCSVATGSGNATISYTLSNSDFGFNVAVVASDFTPVVVHSASVWFGNPKYNGSGLTLSATDSNVGTTASGVNTSVFTGALLTASYQWYDCTAQVSSLATTLPTTGSTCTPISGATSQTYTFAGSDAGSFVLYKITVSNSIGSVTEYSPSTATAVVAVAPSTNSAPALSNQTAYGLSASSGTWFGTPAMTSYVFQWYNCTASVGSAAATLSSACSAISGSATTTTATSLTYNFTSSDIGKYVLVGVTASNGIAPNATQFSASSTVVSGSAPSVLAPATLSGTFAIGSTITLNNATWGGVPTPTSFTYAWYSCTSGTVSASAIAQSLSSLPSGLTSACTQISNSSTTLTLTNQAVVIGEVTATNSTGSYSDFTAASAITQAAAPSTSTDVTVGDGSLTSGKYTATVDIANWNGVPKPTLSYQWYDCSTQLAASHAGSAPSSSTCTAISGATAATYATVENDMGKNLLVAVTGSNATNSFTIYSAGSTILADSSPVKTVSPTITGSGVAGTVQTASTGTWTTLPAPVFTYQWYVCSAQVSAAITADSRCTTVASNGTIVTYTPTVADKATYTTSFLMVAVTATSHAGTVTTYSAAGTQLSAVAPSNASAPTVPATASSLTAMVATSGNWQGSPAPSLSYQWYVCTSLVANSGSSVPSGCSSISGATSGSYTPSGQYAGDYFVVAVTGANGVTTGSGASSVTVFSSSTTVPLVATVSINSLTISGTSMQGSVLTSAINVTSYGTYTTAYQWYSCVYSSAASSSVPYGCSAISGATSSTYTLASTQVGYYVTVLATVTGTTTVYQTAATSAIVTTNIPGAPTYVTATGAIASATVSWVAPTVGAAVTSYTVTSSPGAITCSSSTTSCVVTGLTAGTSYTFSVTATNSYGTSSASSSSGAVTPTSAVPGAPTNVSAIAGNATATVSWSAATANGSAIATYTVTSSPVAGSCTTSSTSCIVASLKNGTAYSFSVTATNLVGTGAASVASNAVTPVAPVPNAPTNVVATGANAKVTVTWTSATSTGATVTGYVVTLAHAVGSGSLSSSCETTTALSCVFSGLKNGTLYSASVVAKSANGNSVSSLVATATPNIAPLPPLITAVRGLIGGILVSFRAPAANGAGAVTSYQYSVNAGVTWTKLAANHIINGLARKTTFTVYLRTVTARANSAQSNAARIKTL